MQDKKENKNSTLENQNYLDSKNENILDDKEIATENQNLNNDENDNNIVALEKLNEEIEKLKEEKLRPC